MEGLKTKRCTKCGCVKPTTEFCVDRSTSDGLQKWCKSCHRTASQIRKIRKAGNLTQSAIHGGSVGVDNNQPFAQMQPREIIAEIRERINFLRANGWAFEGKLTYTQVKEIAL